MNAIPPSINDAFEWPETLKEIEWMRLASPQWRFQTGAGRVSADSGGMSFARLEHRGSEQVIGFPDSRFPPKWDYPGAYVTFDENVFSRLVVQSFAHEVGRFGGATGLWVGAGLGPSSPGGFGKIFGVGLPDGWENSPRDGIGHVYRQGREVLSTDGGHWLDILFLAYTDHFHPDHLLAYSIFGGVTVPIVELPDALGEFIAARPEFTVGWWRPLLPSLELSRSRLGRRDLPPDVDLDDIEAAFRAGQPLPPHVRDHVVTLDALMEARPTPEEVEVVFAPTPVQLPDGLVPGDRVVEMSFLSTSPVGEDFLPPGQRLVVRLRVPAGIPSLYREPVMPGRPAYLTLARGLEWEVDDVVTGSSGALVTGHVVSRRPGELL